MICVYQNIVLEKHNMAKHAPIINQLNCSPTVECVNKACDAKIGSMVPGKYNNKYCFRCLHCKRYINKEPNLVSTFQKEFKNKIPFDVDEEKFKIYAKNLKKLKKPK